MCVTLAQPQRELGILILFYVYVRQPTIGQFEHTIDIRRFSIGQKQPRDKRITVRNYVSFLLK